MIITADNKRQYKTVSRWVQVQHKEVTRRHALEPYAYFENFWDKYGCVSCFRHAGKWYALDQFLRLDHPIFFENEDGKTSYLSGYDCTNYYNTELIEIHPYGEYVRLWEEVKQNNCAF